MKTELKYEQFKRHVTWIDRLIVMKYEINSIFWVNRFRYTEYSFKFEIKKVF